MGCHNEAGLKSGERLSECINEFIRSKYTVMLLQETKLDKKGAAGAESYCEARGIAARFSVREDEAVRRERGQQSWLSSSRWR